MRKGYKQTDVGIIPEDWEIKPLSDLTKEVGDGIHATPEYVNSSDYFFINGNNLLNGQIVITENTMCVGNTEYRRLRKSLDNSTILMSINGTIGNLAFYKDEKVVLGKSAAYISANQKACKEFLYYTLQSNATKTFYENELTGTTIRNLSLGSIRNTPIPLPPTLAEQEAIAEALSDVDALIEAMEQLLTKKRQVKQGAMSELLTGKMRLSGFSGEWEPVSLIDLLTQNATYGIVKAGEFQDIGVPMVRGGDIKGGKISTSDIPFVTEEKSNEFSRTILRVNDVVIALVGYPGEAAKVTPELEGANISRAVGLLRLNNRIYTDYLVCYLNSPIGRSMVLAPSAGSAQQVVNLAALNKLKFKIPDMKEQTAIAEILSDMDAEISALEEKLVKARQVKAGMMSELLTGKVRLVKNAS